jgi:hypothetical protein
VTDPFDGQWRDTAGVLTAPDQPAPAPMLPFPAGEKPHIDWVTRIILGIVMTAALAVGTWSVYTLLTALLHAPRYVAAFGCFMFDGAAFFFARLSQRYATTSDSGLAPRLAMLAMICSSSWVNWRHAQLEKWGTVGGVILAAAPIIAELAFEMWHRFEHREALRRLGRVAQTLPVLGHRSWLTHPFRSGRVIDAHTQAALTEHQAVADRRVEIAEVRARTLVTPVHQTIAEYATVQSAELDQPVRTTDGVTDQSALPGPDHTAGPPVRTATGPDRSNELDRTENSGPDRTGEDRERSTTVDRTARTTDRTGLGAVDRTVAVGSADHGPGQASTDRQTGPDRLILSPTEQQAIELLRSSNRSISKRSIAAAVRDELGKSIGSDRAAEIARHFRTLRSAA